MVYSRAERVFILEHQCLVKLLVTHFRFQFGHSGVGGQSAEWNVTVEVAVNKNLILIYCSLCMGSVPARFLIRHKWPSSLLTEYGARDINIAV
jgi:hypothetical protein